MATAPQHEPATETEPTEVADEPAADATAATGIPAPTALESLIIALLGDHVPVPVDDRDP